MTAGSSAVRGFLLMAAFALAWVTLEEVVGRQLRDPVPLLQVVWCRYAAHLALLALLFGWREPQRLWRTSRPAFQIARSMLMLVMPLSFVASLGAGLPGDLVWALFWTCTPWLVLLGAWRGLGESVPGPAWVAAAACSLAAWLVFPADPGTPRAAWLLPLAMAASFSLYVLMTRSLRRESVRANLFHTAFGVFVLLTPFMPSIWVMPGPHDAAVLAGIGAVGLVSLWALDRACALAPLPAGSPALAIHLPALVLVGAAVHAALPGRRAAVGGLLVLAALWYFWGRHLAPAASGARAAGEGSR